MVQALRENLIDNPVFACSCQLLPDLQVKLHTPVCYHRLHFLELRSSHDEPCEVCCLQLVWNTGGHADGNVLKEQKTIFGSKWALTRSMLVAYDARAQRWS